MTKDYSAVKFEVSEELGEWMNCLYMKRMDGQDWEYDFIHHTQSDGVGAISTILEKEQHTVLEQPKTRKMPNLSFLAKIKLLKRFVSLTKPVNIKWKVPRVDVRGVPESFFLAPLSPAQSSQVLLRAKENKVSLNSWLLFHLDLACKEILLSENSERKWLSPINIRTTPKKLYGNHAASIIINFLEENSSKETVLNLHTEIKNYLAANLHWGSHLYSNMARFIGKKGTMMVAKQIKEVGTGVFSNLGICPSDGVVINPDAPRKYNRRTVLAPATQVLPIASTAWQWEERMTLSLQIHPSLNLKKEVANEVLKKWTQLLQIEREVPIEEHSWCEFSSCPSEKIIRTPLSNLKSTT